jgi:hypothetical protein
MCSDLDYAPGHARGFRNLMNSLGLGRVPSRQPSGATDFSGAHAALKDAQAASRIRQVEQAEQFQVLSAAFNLPLTELRSSLKEVVAQAHDMPVTEVNPGQTGRGFDEHFRAAFNGDEPAAMPFYWIKCGNPNGTHFYICCYLEYEPRNRQRGEILFNLRLDCRHSKGLWNDCERFFFEKDGSFSDGKTGAKRKVANDEIVALFSEWLLRPGHWTAIG